MPNIETRYEPPRGCGFRRAGGLYLVSDRGDWVPCGKLPLAIPECAECARRGIRCGLRPVRGFTWLDADALFEPVACSLALAGRPEHLRCPLGARVGRAGLLWVGEQAYPTPRAFLDEAVALGVSRRIPAFPKGLVLGETWVLLAHRRALPDPEREGAFIPAVFQIFRPSRIEYVVRETDEEERLTKLEGRGATLVRVVRDDLPLFAAEVGRS